MKPLSILLGNNTLALLAGSETWTLTLARQLKKMGHKVECFGTELGIIAEKLEADGIRCFKDITTSTIKPFSIRFEQGPSNDYDIIIANHYNVVEFLRSQFPKTPTISTIHGVLHIVEDGKKQVKAPEHPALESGVNQFIAVSEEVQNKLNDDYHIDSMVIRNFFDTNIFNAKRQISESPKMFLVNSNYSLSRDPEIEVIREVAKHYGAKLTAIGQNFTMSDNTMKAIEDCDVVIGMGRSVLEGVCAGRLGIVHGRWGTGGVVCEESLEELRKCNFSGRNSEGVIWTKEQFIEAIDANFNKKNIDWGKKYIRSEHNVIHAAEEFVSLSRGFLGIGNPEAPIKKLKFKKDE